MTATLRRWPRIIALALIGGMSSCNDSGWADAWAASQKLGVCLRQYERAELHYPDALSGLRSVAGASRDGCGVADPRLLSEGPVHYAGFEWKYWTHTGRKMFVLSATTEPEARERCHIRLDQTFILRRTCEKWWGHSMDDLDLNASRLN